MQRNNKHRERFSRFVTGLLLLLFSLYYINITLFTHYHIVNGVAVVHSHFFTGDHGEQGTSSSSSSEQSAHTQGELSLIKTLSIYLAELQTPLISVAIAISLAVTILLIDQGYQPILRTRRITPLRGPPAFMA